MFRLVDSHRYFAYNKALKGLKSAKKEFATPRELIAVNNIGPGIVATLEKRYALENGGASQPEPTQAPAPKPRGRQVKRSATDVDVQRPPPAERRTTSAAALPTQIPASHPVRPSGNEPFQFWYLGEKFRYTLL